MNTYESRFSCIKQRAMQKCNQRAAVWLYWIVASWCAKLVGPTRSCLLVAIATKLVVETCWDTITAPGNIHHLSPNRGWRVAALNISTHGDPQVHQVRRILGWNASFGPYDFRKLLMRNIDAFLGHRKKMEHIFPMNSYLLCLKPATYTLIVMLKMTHRLCWSVVFFLSIVFDLHSYTIK